MQTTMYTVTRVPNTLILDRGHEMLIIWPSELITTLNEFPLRTPEDTAAYRKHPINALAREHA